jgi:hypothetical protein
MSGIFGGGGGGGSAPANQTIKQENAVSAYAAPYVEKMLGKTEALTDQPYQTYDQQRTADFTGLQNQAFGQAGNLGVMGQTQQASDLAGQAGLGALNMQYDPMMARTQNFGIGAAQQYMNPFALTALQPALNEQARMSAMQGQEQQAQAVGRGAFGGSRDALMRAERERNLGIQQGNTISQGLNTAYNNAMQQFTADQARQLQAQQANIGQQQFGANLGLQGLQTGLSAANTLGQLGQNQYGQQTGNINLQNQLGTQQQQQQQNILNQQYADFQAQKQDPYNKLAFQQSMLSGLPISSNVQSVYQNPSMLSQVAGLGTAAAGAYGMANIGNRPYAKGGKIKEQQRPAGLAELAIHNMA